MMQQMVDRIERAAQKADRAELERIVRELVVIGACDEKRARSILLVQG